MTVAEDKAQFKELDQWIEQLMECKQLGENQVKILCEKVNKLYNRACSLLRCGFVYCPEIVVIFL